MINANMIYMYKDQNIPILYSTGITLFYYMPSTSYIVKLPLVLDNIFNWTESIMAQSHDDAKNPHWGLIMDF